MNLIPGTTYGRWRIKIPQGYLLTSTCITLAHVPHPLLQHVVTTHLHCPKWAGLEWGPGARRGHSVESALEKELEQIDGPGSHLARGDVDNQEMLPCQLLVSVSIT